MPECPVIVQPNETTTDPERRQRLLVGVYRIIIQAFEKAAKERGECQAGAECEP